MKIPVDEKGQNKAIGFVTFVRAEDCQKIVEEGAVKYEFYELPVEAAYMSVGHQQRREGGDRRDQTGRTDGDRSDKGARGGFSRGGGERGGRGGRDAGDRPAYVKKDASEFMPMRRKD